MNNNKDSNISNKTKSTEETEKEDVVKRGKKEENTKKSKIFVLCESF